MKTRILTLSSLLLLNLLILPCSFAEEAIVDTVKITNDPKAALADGEFDQRGYYTFRPDLRMCVSPLCGGFFVKAVNRTLTRCADGSLQTECYIAFLKKSKNLDMSSAALLQGDIRPKIYEGFGNLGIFVVTAAFSSATETVGNGLFVGLENNGILCITTPCFSVDQYVLNKNKLRAISDIDLQTVGASEASLSEALSIMANGGVLIASGANQQIEGVAGKGIAFAANQFYLPIK